MQWLNDALNPSAKQKKLLGTGRRWNWRLVIRLQGEETRVVLLRNNYLEPMHSTACLCPTHSSASLLLCQQLLIQSLPYSPASQPPTAAHSFDSHFQTDQWIASSWQHRPCANRCKSWASRTMQVTWVERKGQTKHSAFKRMDLWAKNPGELKQIQNVNTCGNAGPPYPTQRSFLEQHCDLQYTEVRWGHLFTSTSLLLPHPLPSPAWHWLLIFCSAKCHFIYISHKSKAASNQQSITANLSNFPIHPQANWVKAFLGQLALYSACQIPSICPTEHKEDQKMIKKELHQVPLTATKIWKNVSPRSVLTCTSAAQTWF